MNKQERFAFDSATAARLADAGIVFMHGVSHVLAEDGDPWKRDLNLALDAQPTLVTTANAGIPAYLTTMVDPNILKILTAKNKGAKIIGEVKKGSWVDQQIMFPIAEHTGEVSTYGDFNANGRAGVNVVYPQRQQYLFQTFVEYGDLEAERAGLAKIQWASELQEAAGEILMKYLNLTYFFGVSGLQNYGLLNDPALSAAMTPSTKAATGTSWITSGNAINATANEVFADIQSMYAKLVTQSAGIVDDVDAESEMVLAMSPKTAVALKTTNSFGLTVAAMLKESFPNLRIETAVQYGALTAQNPQGLAGGELVQLIATRAGGQDSGYCAYGEKQRSFPVVRSDSSYRQKKMAGTWGFVGRQPFAFVQMQGV